MNGHKRPVKQFTLTGEYIKTHGSMEKACAEVGGRGTGSSIRRVAIGDQETAYGFKWEYADGEEV